MFWNIYKTRLKVFIREKDIIFWTLCFPICLATILYIAVYKEMVTADSANYPDQVLGLVKLTKVLAGCKNSNEAYFLAIIAQACLIMGFIGIREIEDSSGFSKGGRINLSPVKRYVFLSAGISSAWCLGMFGIIALIVYLEQMLDISLGTQRLWQGIVIGLGTLTGILIGMVVGIWTHGKRVYKQAIVAVLFLTLTFLAGLEEEQIAYNMITNYPVAARCNPAILIVDALYRLKCYGTNAAFCKDVYILAGINCALIGIVLLGGRRQ